MNHIIILAGGIGSRFWPLSRQKNAKQFLNLIQNKSFLEHTLARVLPIAPLSQQWIVTNQSQSDLIAIQAKQLQASQILYEPIGRNTTAAIAWAATELVKRDPDATMVILPSDHWVQSASLFHETIHKAVNYVETHSALVTIGIPPSSPHTGYGYIQTSPNEKGDFLKVKRFKEKPDLETAMGFLDSGDYYWNGGMFVWKAQHILDLIKEKLSNTYETIQLFSQTSVDDSDRRLELYQQLESISIDHGILEQAADEMALLPAPFQWSDIGSWTAAASFWENDQEKNQIHGNCLSIQSKDNIVYSPHKMVALLGVENHIVVDTEDVLLIAPSHLDQEIKCFQDHIDDAYK